MVEILTHVTRDDLVRLGCCVDGVRDFADEHFTHETIVSVAEVVAADLGEYRDLVLIALGCSGSGDCYGYCSGDGSGSGSGDCYGSGYCYGSGSGSGDCYGSGSGSGDGYGYGYGSGDRSGDCSGSGSGYGDGDGYGYGYHD